ncbi:TonB-dependent siderophore receptor [Celerinatantimonas diazotrophica]|uniref:Outer membrane receptor for ferric coprogen and ferric-rhodotorulic acid n=1 Tax=Celerinatantimonas diazotrophica TaxID=412034 RepID=A0A4R1JLW8_9GAMM|nr:TonB-dependent siderophore receptor [Celerinatantimonas diazotrophica]TCK52068.1 outer membrane receptor for ferric coprogen and ferric-rhodotorulic acid [Celerinatantimonas diazotrophica]CAG9296229.1 FhuE receptor [Celerinatantimonas diazotrophica]
MKVQVKHVLKLSVLALSIASAYAIAANSDSSKGNSNSQKSHSNNSKQSNHQSSPTKDKLAPITIVGSYTASKDVTSATGLNLTDREIPQATTVITQQRIKDQDLTNIKDIVENTIGLSNIPADTERNTFISRGFQVSNYQIDGSIQPLGGLGGALGQTLIDLSTYQSVEIVRGATGLTTGSGNPAASINFVRKHANSKKFTGYVNMQTGSWDKREFSTDLSSGLNKDGSVRGRIVAKYNKNNSFIDRYSKETSVLYAVIDADLTENTLLRVGAGMQDNNAPGATWGFLPSYSSDGTLTKWGRSKSTAANWSYYDTNANYYFANLEHYFSNGWKLKIDYNHSQYKQHSQLLTFGGYIDNPLVYTLKSHGKNNANTLDIQLNGNYTLFDRNHEFVTGALYSKQNLKQYYANGNNYGTPFSGNLSSFSGNLATTFPAPTLNANYDTKELGFFAATRFNISDDLKWIAGARVSNWKREGFNTSYYNTTGKITPYTGLLYDITPHHRAYVSYAEIFSPQDKYNSKDQLIAPLEGKTYEIGLKSTYLNDNLHTSIALFRTNQDHYAIGSGTYMASGHPIYEEKTMTSKGFELEATGRIKRGWNISAGYSQYRAKDSSNTDINTNYPKKQLKVFTTYNFVSKLPKLTVGGGVNWQGKIYSDDRNGYRTEQSNYAIFNLMARYDLTPKAQIQLNVHNLFDKTYYNTVYADGYGYGAPLNFTIGLNYKL